MKLISVIISNGPRHFKLSLSNIINENVAHIILAIIIGIAFVEWCVARWLWKIKTGMEIPVHKYAFISL